MARKNTYKITRQFEIVSRYMQNQTEENWLLMLDAALEHELINDWEEENKEKIRQVKGMFGRMSAAVKDLTY